MIFLTIYRYTNKTTTNRFNTKLTTEGHEHILVVIDTFTRFIELYSIKVVTAKVAAVYLLNHSGRYGFTNQIANDNITQFVYEIINRAVNDNDGYRSFYCHSLDLKQENDIVERSNKEILRYLKAIVFDDKIKSKDTWHESLPFVQEL